jgi:hypothetical protein
MRQAKRDGLILSIGILIGAGLSLLVPVQRPRNPDAAPRGIDRALDNAAHPDTSPDANVPANIAVVQAYAKMLDAVARARKAAPTAKVSADFNGATGAYSVTVITPPDARAKKVSTGDKPCACGCQP